MGEDYIMELNKLSRNQIPQFIRAIAHNRTTILDQITTGRFCHADYYFVEYTNGAYSLLPPGRRDAELARNFNDYFAGALVGALPFAARHGSDGIKVSSTGGVTEVELKLCFKTPDRYGVNAKGNITVLTSKKAKGIKSDCKACYEIANNLAGKEVDTYFVLYDNKNHDLVTVWKIPGQAIVERLAKNLPKKGEKAKKMNITLSALMTEGEEVFLDFIDTMGLEAWEDTIYAAAGRSRPPVSQPRLKNPTTRQNIRWTSAMEDQLNVLVSTGLTYDELAKVFKVSRNSISNKLSRIRRVSNH